MVTGDCLFVARAPGNRDRREAIALLVSALHDVERWVRRAVWAVAGMIGDMSVVDPLSSVPGGAEWRVREAAVRPLDTLGNGQMVFPFCCYGGVRRRFRRASGSKKIDVTDPVF